MVGAPPVPARQSRLALAHLIRTQSSAVDIVQWQERERERERERSRSGSR